MVNQKFIYQFLIVYNFLLRLLFLSLFFSVNTKIFSFTKLYTLKGHRDIVQSMKILKDGRLVSGSADSSIRVWDIINGVCIKCFNTMASVNAVEVLTDGRFICGSPGAPIVFFDYEKNTNTMLENLKKESVCTNFVMQLTTGEIIFSGGRRVIKIWDIDKDRCSQIISSGEHNNWTSSVLELKKNGYIVASSWDKTIKIWDKSNEIPKCINILEGHTDCVNVVMQLNDRFLVSGGDDKAIITWDIDDQYSKQMLLGHKDRVYALHIVDGKIISGSRDKTVKIWDPQSKNCLATIECKDKIYSLAYSQEKQYLFVGLGCGDIDVFKINVANLLSII